MFNKNETIYTPILKKIKEERDVVISYMASGRPKNYEEYQRLVGRLEGLQFIETDILGIEKKFIEEQGLQKSQVGYIVIIVLV